MELCHGHSWIPNSSSLSSNSSATIVMADGPGGASTAVLVYLQRVATGVTVVYKRSYTTVTPVATRWRYTSTAVDAPPGPSAITIVADELLLRLLLLGIQLWPWHSSAAPPVEAAWIANNVGVCVCVVVRVGDAVVVAVAILTTAVACTFEPLWSGTDLGHMPESSAPLALVHAAHRRVGRGWRFLLVPPSSVGTTIKWPSDPPFGLCMMRGTVRL